MNDLTIPVVIFLIFAIVGGMSGNRSLPTGLVWTEVTEPISSSGAEHAQFPHYSWGVFSIFWLFSWGDCGISVPRAGPPRLGILSHVDQHTSGILGITKKRTYVYGSSP